MNYPQFFFLTRRCVNVEGKHEIGFDVPCNSPCTKHELQGVSRTAVFHPVNL